MGREGRREGGWETDRSDARGRREGKRGGRETTERGRAVSLLHTFTGLELSVDLN